MASPLIKILMTWNLKNKDERFIAKLFLKLFDKLPTLDQKTEILYVLADFEPNKLRALYRYLRPVIVYLIRSNTFPRLRVLMLYYAKKCPTCLKLFMETFKDPIREKFDNMHFNDFIIFSLDLARINTEAAVNFVNTFRSTLEKLALGEGFNHFGTILWHMLMMKQAKLAYTLFNALLGVIIKKVRYLTEIQNLYELINRIDQKFAQYVLVKLEPKIRTLLERATPRERKIFLNKVPIRKSVESEKPYDSFPSNMQFLNDKW